MLYQQMLQIWARLVHGRHNHSSGIETSSFCFENVRKPQKLKRCFLRGVKDRCFSRGVKDVFDIDREKEDLYLEVCNPRCVCENWKEYVVKHNYVSLTLWPWSWTFTVQHTIYVKCEYFMNQEG